MVGSRQLPPTRMQLTLMQEELKTAEQGHKLLKDKQDELVRQFLILFKKARKLRQEAEEMLSSVSEQTLLSSAPFSQAEIEDCFMVQPEQWTVDITEKNIMGLSVPVMTFPEQNEEHLQVVAPSPEIYQIAEATKALFPKLLALSEVEATCNLLAKEIEKVRRRVNALEYRRIPDLKKGIRYIRMKLDDKEREGIIRMLKSKDYQQ